MMVHKGSRRTGPIIRAAKVSQAPEVELTLKTYDGIAIQGLPADFEPATSNEYCSFVEGFLSNVPVSQY